MEYDLFDHYHVIPELNKSAWRTLTRNLVLIREKREWRGRLDSDLRGSGGKAWYARVKTTFGFERYLTMGDDDQLTIRGRRLMAHFRCNTRSTRAPLMAILNRQEPLVYPSPLCLHCHARACDGQVHVLAE